MKKTLVLFIFLSGCATKNIVDLSDNKYLAVANDSTGIPSATDSLENANLLARQKCGAQNVVVDSISTRNDTFNFPETSVSFHCK